MLIYVFIKTLTSCKKVMSQSWETSVTDGGTDGRTKLNLQDSPLEPGVQKYSNPILLSNILAQSFDILSYVYGALQGTVKEKHGNQENGEHKQPSNSNVIFDQLYSNASMLDLG